MSNHKKISNERKTIYQIGIVLTIIGFLLIISVFITFTMNFGNFENFDSQAKSEMFRFGGGMLLIIIGKICQSLGRLGVAGSGFILDTEKERKDLEPISRMLGGQLHDALEETD